MTSAIDLFITVNSIRKLTIMDNNNPLGGTNLTYCNESRGLYASVNH